MNMTEPKGFSKVGEVLDYMRTKPELRTIDDSRLPKPIRERKGYEFSGWILGIADSPYILAEGGEKDSRTILYFSIDNVNVDTFLPLENFDPIDPTKTIAESIRDRYTEMFPGIDLSQIMTVTRRKILGEEAYEERVVKVDEGFYLAWTGGEFDRYGKVRPRRLPYPPFKIGEDEYFEARREFNLDANRIVLEFDRFSDPVQKKILYKIAESNGIEIDKLPLHSGRTLQMEATLGFGIRTRAVRIAGERALFKDNTGYAPLTNVGIDSVCNMIGEYDSALKSDKIISLRRRYKKIEREMKGLPEEALKLIE